MELEELLGQELYPQVKAKLDEVNAKEPDKLKHVRFADLSEGNYVSKQKFESELEKLNNLITGKDSEISNANQLIDDLKKASKGNEDMQAKFAQYEQQNAQLQQQLKDAEIRYAFEVMLMNSGCTDKDEREFLTYKYQTKIKDEGKTLELDENKHIKSADSIIESLKIMRPKAFESGSAGSKDEYRVLGDNKLKQGYTSDTLTKSDLLKKPYAERARIAQENPEAYAAAMNS